jgi:hypothetical protein
MNHPHLLLVAACFLCLTTPAKAQFDSCATQIAVAEATTGIPRGLLNAIAIAESGRWDRDRRIMDAWPWTVTSGNSGRFFASKADAIGEVQRLKAEGVRNIDVGCMQVNLLHHPAAFASLDEAFDPTANVSYAARFLRSLYDTRQDWMTAAAHYHSMTPVLAATYRAKLTALLAGWRTGAGWVQIKPMKDIWDDAALEKAKAANLAWRERQLAEYHKLKAARLSELGSPGKKALPDAKPKL